MSKLKLLIIDDDSIIGLMMQKITEPVNVDTRYTGDAGEFFEQMEQWRPDFIVLDLVMPEVDGVQLIIELAKRRCKARIIITSGVCRRVLDAARRSAAEHGLMIAGVLPKPFSPSALKSLLHLDPGGDQGTPMPLPATPDWQNIGLAELKQALVKGDIFVMFQPKVSARTGDVTGFEALARWQHATVGMIPPDHFITLAENGGLIDELSRQVFEQALTHFDRLCLELENRQFTPSLPLSLSINISACSLSCGELMDWLNVRVDALGMSTERVVIELTETGATADAVGALDMLTRIRMRGFQLSIDDIGTGFSSMQQLTRLPFSELKIDKSFVMSAMSSRESRLVIESIIVLGHNLDLTVTAEGVEDEVTLAYLCDAGCDLLQGYHIARPMLPEQLCDWFGEYDAGNVARLI